jgi:hypothetical protein
MQDVRNWSNYVEGYTSDRVNMDQVITGEKTRRKNADHSSSAAHSRIRKPVFLQRNLKQWERRRRKDGALNPSRIKTESGNLFGFNIIIFQLLISTLIYV